MLSAGERLVLAKCHELSGQGFGFVPDSELSIHTQVTLELVRDYLRGLDSEQLVELVPLEGAAVEGDPLQLHEQEHVLGGSAPIFWALASGGRSANTNSTNARRFLMTTTSEMFL